MVIMTIIVIMVSMVIMVILFHKVTGINQFARWNPFDGTPPAAPQMNGGPGVTNPIGQELGQPASTELNHSCSQGSRSKRACSPGSGAGWQEEEEGGNEIRNGWAAFQKCDEKRNGWVPQFTSSLNTNGDHPASDLRPSNGGNILMVRLQSS